MFIKSHLRNRYQRCKIGDLFSEWERIIAGVLQGSILGPLLFSIFINNVFLYIENSDLCTYADDSTLYASEESLSMIIENLKADFLRISITCNGTRIESSKEEKVFSLIIDDKLTFTWHLGNIIKKPNQNFHALSRVKSYMGSEQNKLIMSSFIKFQFSYCPLIWMFCSRTSMNKLNNEKCLRLVTNDYDSNFNKLLKSSHEVLIHETCFNYLMIEVCRYLLGLSPELMTDIFTLLKNPYNIHNICLFGSENPRSVRFAVDVIVFVLVIYGNKYP